jgi:hypothetical protein
LHWHQGCYRRSFRKGAVQGDKVRAFIDDPTVVPD